MEPTVETDFVATEGAALEETAFVLDDFPVAAFTGAGVDFETAPDLLEDVVAAGFVAALWTAVEVAVCPHTSETHPSAVTQIINTRTLFEAP